MPPTAPAPDVLRCAYMELTVTDLAKSREFYADILGLVVTEEDENAVYLRSFEEFIHHNLVLRKADTAAVAAFGFRVRSPEDVDKAEAYYRELGCDVRRGSFTKGISDAVRVLDTFPAASHPPIVYPAAIVAGHDSPAARRLLARLREPAQQAIFRAHGFDAPPR